MKKKSKKKKQVRACAFGIGSVQGIAGIGNAVGSTMQGASDEGSGVNIAGGTLGGAAKGASVGAALVPIGAIGAVAGGVIGAAGGLFTGFKKKKELEEKRKRELRIKLANVGANNAAENEMEYWDENELAYTYATGGIIPNDLAFLDNNEIIRNVDGNIEQVPNTKPGTDNHLVDATNLESVLSDKLKRPGTKRTFAQEGAILARMSKPSKGTDRFAENSNRLNKIAANKRYNKLLIEQELVKQKKGIKPKTKGIATNEVPAYGDGVVNYTGQGANIHANWSWLTDAVTKAKEYLTSPRPQLFGSGKYAWDGGRTNLRGFLTGSGEKTYNTIYTWPDKPKTTTNTGQIPLIQIDEVDPILQPIDIKNTNISTIKKTNYSNEIQDSRNNSPMTISPNVKESEDIERKNILQADIYPDLYGGELARKPVEVEAPRQYTPDEIKTINKNRKAWDAKNARDAKNAENGSTDWEQLASLAPTLYNFAQGLRPAEKESTVLNPNSGSISRALAKRRVNIEPARRENRKARAIANYNAANTNANTGMNLAVRNQIAASEYAQNADIYANRDNANNTYLGEYANMMNNLGQQYVQSQTLTNDLNAKNRASARNFGASAASQLGEWSQVNKQMKNQQRRDDMVYPLLENFLSQGYTQAQINQLRKSYGSK